MEPKVKKCLIDMHRPCSKHAWTGKKLKILIIHQKQNKNMIKFVDLH